MGNVTTLLSSGLDAFVNLYDVFITVPKDLEAFPLATNTGAIAVRALDFQPAELNAKEYNVPYKAVEITRLAPKIEGQRVFTLSFRMDDSYSLYKLFMAWKHIWADPSGQTSFNFGSLSGTTPATKYGSVKVSAYKSSTSLDKVQGTDSLLADTAATWTYNEVIVQKVEAPSFQRGDASPATFKVTCIFGTYQEPTATAGANPNQN